MMKKLVLAILAWLVSAQLALAAVSIINSDTVTGSVPGSGTPSITFSTRNTGTPAADRITAVVFALTDTTSSGITIASATVGGNATTCTASASDGSINQTVLCWVLNASGTTATIVATFSANTAGLTLVNAATYAVTGANTTTPISSTATTTASQNPATSITITANGELLAGSTNVGSGTSNTVTWTNATADTYLPNGTVASMVSATAVSTTSGTPTVTAGWSATSSLGSSTLSLVAFQAPGGGATVIPLRARRGYGN